MQLAFALVLVALAAFSALTLWRVARRERAAEAATPAEGWFVEVDGLRVHAVVRGSGPDLVLLHGSSGNWRDGTFRLAGALADRYRVIVFDRPGLGYSDRLPKGSEDIFTQAAHLSRAAAKLGARHPVVVGHSLGGAVALAWALDHPASALVTVSGVSHAWTTPLPRLYRINSSALGSLLAVPLITAWVSQPYVDAQIDETFAPQAPPAGYHRHFPAGLTLRRGALRSNAAQRAGLLADIEAMQHRYGSLQLPFELVHGTADEIVDFDLHAGQMAAQAPAVSIIRLDGIGHMPHQVATDAIVAAIDRAAARLAQVSAQGAMR